jgi:hypothetical protein
MNPATSLLRSIDAKRAVYLPREMVRAVEYLSRDDELADKKQK